MAGDIASNASSPKQMAHGRLIASKRNDMASLLFR